MKNLLYYLPAMALSLVLSSCESELLDPQYTISATNSADAKMAKNFQAHLKPGEETAMVDSKATGQIILKLSKDGTQLYYKLIVANIETVRFGHLHLAPAGKNGNVVATLVGRTENNPNGVIAEGIITSESLQNDLAGMDLSDLIEAIEAGNIYTNVHSDKYPAGEIRGQVK